MIKINLLFKYKSVCGRVVKTSGLILALTGDRPIIGSSPDGACQFTCHFFL